LEPLEQLGRALLIVGALVAAVGALLYFGGRLPLRLGRLPGDIVYRGRHGTFFFPLASSLLLSVLLSLLLWGIGRFRR